MVQRRISIKRTTSILERYIKINYNIPCLKVILFFSFLDGLGLQLLDNEKTLEDYGMTKVTCQGLILIVHMDIFVKDVAGITHKVEVDPSDTIGETLFINKRFALNKMFQRNASKFAIFYV